MKAAEPTRITGFDQLAFTLLLPCMVGWYLWCRLRGRIHPQFSFFRAWMRAATGPASGTLAGITFEEGHCYRAPIPRSLIDDQVGRSTLVAYENGVALPVSHAGHDEIRAKGLGRYSHWDGFVWFSTSDNTDPTRNGRNYTYREAWQ